MPSSITATSPAPGRIEVSGTLDIGDLAADVIVSAQPLADGHTVPLGSLAGRSSGEFSLPPITVRPGDYTVSASVEAAASLTSNVTVAAREPAPPEPTLPPDPGPSPSAGLEACISYAGEDHTFRIADGIDRGDYRDPDGRFVQGRVDVTNPALSGVMVSFRCDKSGAARTEVVIELGDTTVGATAANMDAYVATISDDGEPLAVIGLPAHYWYSRWRWQSAPRPITATLHDLQAAGLLPLFNPELAGPRPMSPDRFYEPMGLAGLTAYMPSTGERDEIGLVTEAQAEYFCDETVLPDSLIAQAEASGTFPWHFRNEDGGVVFDFKAHPQATLYWPANIPVCTTPITLDVAHEPPLAYLPFLLTGDPYYLEELQFAATYNVLASNGAARGSFCLGFALRGHAWALRVLAQCAKVTPDDAPAGWFQSRAYWQEWLDQERDWMLSRFVNPTAAPFNTLPYQPFHFMQSADGSPASSTIAGGTFISPWMEDYEAAVLCHVVMIGHADWQPILEWKLVNTIDRTNGTSGWVRARTTIYNMVLRETPTSPYVADWPAVWDLNVKMQPPEFSDIADPDTIPSDASLIYASYTMSSLAMAATLGVDGAADCYAWLHGQIIANSDANTYIDRKWAIAG
jgi:hypothetical protein